MKTSSAKFEPTGEQLRVKVAELCGWKLKPAKGMLAFDVAHYGGPPLIWSRGKIETNLAGLPDYPNNLNACLTQIDFLADKSWTCRLDNGLDKTWECTFETGRTGHRDFNQFYEPADTLAVAICRAFVKTMESTPTPKEKE